MSKLQLLWTTKNMSQWDSERNEKCLAEVALFFSFIYIMFLKKEIVYVFLFT